MSAGDTPGMRLAAASERVPGRPARRSLALSVAPAFGSRLLLPRLPAFRRLHPDISIAIDTNHRQVDMPVRHAWRLPQ